MEKIKKEYNIKVANNKIVNLNNNKNDKEQEAFDLNLNDKKVLQMIEKKLDYLKDKPLEENNKKEKNLSNVKSQEKEEKKEEKNDNENDVDKEEERLKEILKRHKEKEEEELRKQKIAKRFRILKDCIMLLKYNNISFKDFLNKNPLQSEPFQLKNSFEFIQAVKYDHFEEMKNYLKNPDLLYSFDYYRQTAFHWAAKRNKIKGARLLIEYGNCVNQIDINNMTPLAIAAKSNYFEMVQLLLENGANPFIPNKEGKRPVDLTSDIKIKTYLINWGENYTKYMKIKRLFR